jgi:hypothetical protein
MQHVNRHGRASPGPVTPALATPARVVTGPWMSMLWAFERLLADTMVKLNRSR